MADGAIYLAQRFPDRVADMRCGVRLLEFGDHLIGSGRSESTALQYRKALGSIIADGLDLVAMTEPEVMEYLRSKKRGNAIRIRALKAWGEWAVGRVREDNPCRDLALPRRPEPPAPNLTDEELRRIFQLAFRRRADIGWTLMALYATGSRVTAFCHVERDDVDLEAGTVYFRDAKAGASYAVPLSRKAAIAYRHLLAGDGRPVKVEPNAIRGWLRSIGEQMGVHLHPHLLRHAFLTRVAQSTGMEPATLSDLAGWHGSISQYRRYVAVNDEKKLRALAAV